MVEPEYDSERGQTNASNRTFFAGVANPLSMGSPKRNQVHFGVGGFQR